MLKKFKRNILDYFLTLYHKLESKIPIKYINYLEYRFSKFYGDYLPNKILLCGDNLICEGKLDYNDDKGLIIGKNVTLGSNIKIKAEGGVTIGDGSFIGSDTIIYSKINQPINNETGVYIGKNVIVEPKSILMPGVKINDNSFIRAGSIVTKDSMEQISSHKIPLKFFDSNFVTATEKDNKLFFVLSTGRSGSQTICSFLNQHEEVNCLHEPRSQLISLSSEYEYGNISDDELKDIVSRLYNNQSVINKNGLYGESNQKLSNMILLLDELFPKAKFIWLIRDGKKVVSSATARGWYGDEDKALSTWNKKGWANNRLDGSLTGSFSSTFWKSMTAFEKNCWYWEFWNTKIESQLKKISKDKWIQIDLDDLEAKSSTICEFLGVTAINFKAKHSNKAKANHTVVSSTNWDEKKIIAFDKYCGSLYKKYFS